MWHIEIEKHIINFKVEDFSRSYAPQPKEPSLQHQYQQLWEDDPTHLCRYLRCKVAGDSYKKNNNKKIKKIEQ